LNEFIQSGKSFTAYDVTVETRKRVGPSVNIRHSDVQQFVHGNFQDLSGSFPTSYSKQVIHLPAGNPILYFPVTSDPSDYVTAHGGKVTAPNTGGVPSVDDGISSPTDDDSIGLLVNVTKENRVNIPQKALTDITPSSGSYDVEVNGQLHFVKINADGRIRVTVPYKEGDNVQITPDTKRNCIVLTKYSN